MLLLVIYLQIIKASKNYVQLAIILEITTLQYTNVLLCSIYILRLLRVAAYLGTLK